MAAHRRGPETLPSCSVSVAGQMHLQRQRQLKAQRAARALPAVLITTEQRVELARRQISSNQLPAVGYKTLCPPDVQEGFEELVLDEEEKRVVRQKKQAQQQQKQPMKALGKKCKSWLRLKMGTTATKRLVSGGFAGALSRTAVAPLETIRTHLMVGTGADTVSGVFNRIVKAEGWKGLFRGNGVNVIRVAPSKAIELFAYDTVKKVLSPNPGEPSKIPFPISTVAGASAGVCSTVCTYPLELLKTRLTIQRGVYDNMWHALVSICEEEGMKGLYRGLTPSVIGVIPYAAINYFSYDTLRKTYKRVTKEDQIGNLATLCIGSCSAAMASAATFPLEVARKQMQVGSLSGRPVYNNVLHALTSIAEQQGVAGLYRGLGASCIKLMPAAGISFMCYEACKRVLIEDEADRQ